MPEKYIIDISEKGSEGLGKLDYLYNPTTQEFLLRSGLKSGMNVLDIGCGSGVMTCWLAEQVGKDGAVVGIENNLNQLNAAKKRAADAGIHNATFKLCSAYDIDTLNEKFDLIYCRFLLHHLHNPMKAIEVIYQSLKPNGVYAAEEGIVNYAFSYPHSFAWGAESARLPPVWTDVPVDNRDGNIGVKMATKMQQSGFKINSTKVIHPVMWTKQEKQLLLLGIDEMKDFYLSEGHSEDDWKKYVEETRRIVNCDDQIIGFYGSFQVAGIKT